MSPQRRAALASVVAAAALITIKLVAGLASGSLGLVAESLHSGTDLIAALLTFFAVGISGRPADRGHPYGHGKAEHLAALAEASVLALVSVAVAGLAVARLGGWVSRSVDAHWWAFAAVGAVLALDLSRTIVSLRAAREYQSAALLSNALHFGSDFAGTLAVLAGLISVRAGWDSGDSIAALFVAVLVLSAATRLMRRNVDVLMDRAPADAVAAARASIHALDPPVQLRRLRLRHAGGRAFLDVVIGVHPGAAVAQGHAAADRVEAAVQRALPGSDVVVHVEPIADEADPRERIRAAAMSVSHVREIHNLSVIDTADGLEVSLHLKLPGETRLGAAHDVAEQVERAIDAAVPAVVAVQTHIEPLTAESAGRVVERDPAEVERIVVEATGERPRQLRFLNTDEGLVVFLTLGLESGVTLADAHRRASAIEERVRAAVPEVADVLVHTEP
jgi:cation diffusion facilitator family transporter